MYRPLASLDIKVLEKMYSREIEILKFKLLSGAFTKEILKQKNKAVELALAIHTKQSNGLVACKNFSFEDL
jgi:hypothetical protein